MASYVMYGFDTAGALAEETGEPRRRAPWAILQALAAAGLAGGLLILFGILAVSDPGLPELGRISGGLPFLVKNVLGDKLGVLAARRSDLRRLRVRPGGSRRGGPADVRDGPRPQPAVCRTRSHTSRRGPVRPSCPPS